MEEFLAPPSIRSRLKTRLVQTSNPKLPLAGDGSEPGPVIKAADEASAWNHLFKQCDSSKTVEVGDPGPSFIDVEPLRPKLAELDSDSCSSTRSFLDSGGRRWMVQLDFSEKRVCRLRDYKDVLERALKCQHKRAQDRDEHGLPRPNSGT